jgi:hypothetical protein
MSAGEPDSARPPSQPFRAGSDLTPRQVLALGELLAGAVQAALGIRAPVDVDQWCGDAGVALQWVCMALTEGEYLRAESRPIVRVRPDEDLGRRHFTLAHELGHHFLEEARCQPAVRRRLGTPALRWLSRVAVGGPDEERICDTFAAAMLLPRTAVTKFVRTDQYSLRSLLQLAEHYQVTPAMAAVRITELSDVAVCYLRCHWERSGWQVYYRAGGRGFMVEDAVICLPAGAPRRGQTTAQWRGRRHRGPVNLDIDHGQDVLVALLVSRAR